MVLFMSEILVPMSWFYLRISLSSLMLLGTVLMMAFWMLPLRIRWLVCYWMILNRRSFRPS